MEHKAFIIYKSHCKVISSFNNEMKWELFWAIIDYHETWSYSIDNPMVEMAFQFMKQQFDLDREKYEILCEKRAEAWKLWWISKSKQMLANASKWNQMIASDPKDKDKEKVKDKEINTSIEVVSQMPEEFWKKEINQTLKFLQSTIKIDSFKESVPVQRQFANHIYKLFTKIGNEEAKRRLYIVLSDSFKKKNCNSIKYLYWELKSVPTGECIVPENNSVISPIRF